MSRILYYLKFIYFINLNINLNYCSFNKIFEIKNKKNNFKKNIKLNKNNEKYIELVEINKKNKNDLIDKKNELITDNSMSRYIKNILELINLIYKKKINDFNDDYDYELLKYRCFKLILDNEVYYLKFKDEDFKNNLDCKIIENNLFKFDNEIIAGLIINSKDLKIESVIDFLKNNIDKFEIIKKNENVKNSNCLQLPYVFGFNINNNINIKNGYIYDSDNINSPYSVDELINIRGINNVNNIEDIFIPNNLNIKNHFNNLKVNTNCNFDDNIKMIYEKEDDKYSKLINMIVDEINKKKLLKNVNYYRNADKLLRKIRFKLVIKGNIYYFIIKSNNIKNGFFDKKGNLVITRYLDCKEKKTLEYIIPFIIENLDIFDIIFSCYNGKERGKSYFQLPFKCKINDDNFSNFKYSKNSVIK